MTQDIDLTIDHAGLTDNLAARRYFAKFERITDHLARVAGEMERERTFSKTDVSIVSNYVQRIAATFRALSQKYLLTGRDTGVFFGSLNIDRVESGFPVFGELMTMANDAQQAGRHLDGMRSQAELKDEMIRQIVGDLTIPTKLQYAMSQRLYYEELARGDLFWAHNDPQAIWQGNSNGRKRYLIHWAVYDSRQNVPTIYLMEVEDSGDISLPKDDRRWPAAQAHLAAQSTAGLKLLTIAQGFDRDFDDLHPKRLRRVHVGPMYSSAFTLQSGPIREVLEEAQAAPGEDWALAWTIEELWSERVELEKKGWFGQVEREIFRLDPFAGRGAETGATSIERAIILPQKPFQVLAERQPQGFASVRKFVVSPAGRVVAYK
ncbi:hypothetical protein [Litoreibacter roseus]|uniref:Uncharacterized protein n=1 Tax=Litoreibacter roseus TaxID=2601869 RepID=A0A6N6JGI9_9RHOB|nr:hypothetical protein [Litoreibacter roseus]GFE65234.1 hypothetical protein KIN_23080 [Litoreibacter roseus]